MTDNQRLALLRSAEKELKLTTRGHVQWKADGKEGGHWKRALAAIDKLERDLAGPPVPDLGPLWIPGKSVLDHDLTHATTGVPLYPAYDDAFNQGRVILAVEPMEVFRQSSANPGEAFYAKGKSGLRYWYGHLDRGHPVGRKFAKGDAVGKVAANTIGGGPHVHLGINIELIAGQGKQLKHHTNYTHGAPTVGAQLRVLLAT